MEKPENRRYEAASPEDEAKMAENLREAEGILFTEDIARKIYETRDEETGKEEAAVSAVSVLREEARKEKEFVSEQITAFFASPERTEKFLNWLEKTYNWSGSEREAMFDVLHHGITNFYKKIFAPPDNKEPDLGSRDFIQNVWEIIEHDYSYEVAEKVRPLLNFYATKVKEILAQKNMKKGEGEEGESDEKVNSNQ